MCWSDESRPAVVAVLCAIALAALVGLASSVHAMAGNSCEAQFSASRIDAAKAMAKQSYEELLRPRNVTQTLVTVGETTSQEVRVVEEQGVFTANVEKKSITRHFREVWYEYPKYFVEISMPFFQEGSETVGLASSKDRGSVEVLRSIYKPRMRGIHSFDHFAQYCDSLFPKLDFVLREYRDRKGWPDSFLRDLAKIAFRYVFQSTYISVRLKDANGRPGQVVGTIRFVSAPYLRSEMGSAPGGIKPLVREESFAKYQNLRNETAALAIEVKVPAQYAQDPLWKALFPDGYVFLKARDKEAIQAPPSFHKDGVDFVPTPMELVLKGTLGLLRGPDDQAKNGLSSLIEPGNFSIDPAYADIAVMPLYFHAARVSESLVAERAMGMHSRSVTYAEVKSSSDKYYQSLGLDIYDVSKDIENNPTHAPWNILAGERGSLVAAAKKRFNKISPGLGDSFPNSFSMFDSAEILGLQQLAQVHNPYDNSFVLYFGGEFPDIARQYAQDLAAARRILGK